MATIYRGLNTGFFLNDIINDNKALTNLGLNPDDLDIINGISRGADGITSTEFRTISNLTLDAQKELGSLSRSGGRIEQLLTTGNRLDFTNRVFDLNMEFNADVNDQLRAGAIKYKFYDYARNTRRSADISTSRISSWSSIGTGTVDANTPIVYGSDVEILGGKIKLDSLATTYAPAAKRYPAEVATDTVTFNVNGTDTDFYVMRDIPLVAYGTFRNASFNHKVDELPVTYNGNKQIAPVWRIENINNHNDFLHTYSGDAATGTSSVGLESGYTFRDPAGRTLTRKIEFYFHPDYVKYLRLSSINMTDLPQASLSNAETLDFSFNRLETLPALYGALTPNLKDLNLRVNTFGTANAAGVNTTLTNFFSNGAGGSMTNLETLNLQATFLTSDSIDFTYLTSLKNLYWRGYYNRYNYRRPGGTVFPDVAVDTIVNYDCSYHTSSKLPFNLHNCNTIQNLTLSWTSLNGHLDAGGNSVSALTFPRAQTSMRSISITGGSASIIDVSSMTNLTSYYHQYVYGSAGTITGKFSGGPTGSLEKLTQAGFYRSYITGNLGGEFSNKPALTYLDLRFTNFSGGLGTSEFSGSTNLSTVYIQGGNWSGHGDNFFGNTSGSTGYSYSASNDGTVSDSNVFTPTNMYRFYAFDNRNISGFLPNMTQARNLYYLLLRNTNLTGTIPNFAFSTNLQYLRLEGCRFTGQIPTFSNSSFRYIRLENNQFQFGLPTQSLSNCYLFYAHGNSLSGDIPSFANCPNLQYLKLDNNNFTGYISTSMSTARYIRNFDVSGNNLQVPHIQSILSDMLANYQLRPRRGVTVNLLGQNVSGGVGESDLSEDSLATLNNLRSFGWNILL
jgi:hypothetical protein